MDKEKSSLWRNIKCMRKQRNSRLMLTVGGGGDGNGDGDYKYQGIPFFFNTLFFCFYYTMDLV